MELLRSRVSKTTARPFDLLKLLGGLKAPTQIPVPAESESIGEDASLQNSVSSSIASTPTPSFGPTSVASTSQTVPTPLPSTDSSTSNLKSGNDSCGVVLLLSKGVYAAPEATMDPQHLEAWVQIRIRLANTLRNTFRPRDGSDSTLAMEFMMAGLAPSSLKPSVVLVCCSPDSQKQLKKILKTQKWLSEYEYHFLVIVDRVWELSGDDEEVGDGSSVEAWNVADTSSLSGIAARSRSYSGSATTFTIGGVITVNGSLYGLTAGHVFRREAHDSGFESESPEGGSTSDLDRGFEGCDADDTEDDDDDSPFVSFTVATREGPSHSRTEGEGHAQTPTTPWKNPDQQIIPPRALGVMNLGHPSVIGSFYQPFGVSGHHLDWALINLQDPYPSEWRRNVLSLPGSLAKVTISGTVNDAELQDPKLRREVWINSGMSGLVRGRLLHSPTSLLLRGNLCEAWQVLVDTPLVPGDSGSWVIRDGRVCGHIIASRETAPFAYMLSMDAIMADMNAQSGGSADISLPVSSSPLLPSPPFRDDNQRGGREEEGLPSRFQISVPKFSLSLLNQRFQRLRPQSTVLPINLPPSGSFNDTPEPWEEIPRLVSPSLSSWRGFSFQVDTPRDTHHESAPPSPSSTDPQASSSPQLLSSPIFTSYENYNHDSSSTRRHHRYGDEDSLDPSSPEDAQNARLVQPLRDGGNWDPIAWWKDSAITRSLDWKPVPMRRGYLCILFAINVVIIATLVTALSLAWAIQLPFDDKNRIAGFRIAPIIAATVISPLWDKMASEVARLDPFYHLAGTPGGVHWTTADHSVNLDYVTRNPLSRLIRSLADGHYVVAASSVASLLSTVILPVLSTGIISIHTDDDPHFPTPSTVARLSLHPVYTVSTVGALVTMIACIVPVFSRTRVGSTGLSENVQGIAGLALLVTRWDTEDRGWLHNWKHAFDQTDLLPMAELHREVEFRSVFTLNHGRLATKPVHDVRPWTLFLQLPRKTRFGRTLDLLSDNIEAVISTLICRLGFLNPRPVSLALMARLGSVFGIFCVLLLVGTIRSGTALDTTGLIALLVCAKFVWNQIDSDVQLVDPWIRLRRRNAPAPTLSRDFNRLSSLLVITAILDRSWVPFVTASVSASIPVMLLGVAWFGALPMEWRELDEWCILMATATGSVLSIMALIVTIYRVRNVLPRHPASIASVLAYLHQSSITDESSGILSIHHSGNQYSRLDYKKSYGLGWFKGTDDVVRCGVDCEPLIADYHFGENGPPPVINYHLGEYEPRRLDTNVLLSGLWTLDEIRYHPLDPDLDLDLADYGPIL